MAISSLGVGSGLDLNGIITKLMQVEQQPLFALQAKEAIVQGRISALGSLKSVLSGVQTAASALILATDQTATAKFASFKASVADTTIATATATTGAISGSYSLEITSLAQTHRITSPDSTDVPGTAAVTAALLSGGSLKIELGSISPTYTYTADAARELNITINPASTIEQVRDAINAASTDGRVAATIITGTNGKQLVITSGKSGAANALRLSGLTGFDFDPSGSATGSGTLSQTTAKGGQSASDAAFKLNGIAGTSSTNTVSGALDGVTLTLLKSNSGTPTTLTVTKDASTGLKTALNGLIKSYNEATKTIGELGTYNATTKQAAALQGNATLRGAQSQLRALIFSQGESSSVYQRLSDIGVSVQKDGSLKLDATKLDTAVTSDFEGVAALVSVVGTAFKTGMESLTSATGTVTAATSSANATIKEYTKREQIFSERLTSLEARYRKQFSALDTLISGLNQTSSYLAQQLANLPGSSGS